MEAVQQTVIHLDRAAMPSQAQMAYSQRNPQIHGRNVNHGVVQVPGENGPYKPSSVGTGPVHNNFAGYPANIRYVSQPVYMSATTTASNAYRDVPFHSRALNISDRGVTIGVPFELARSDMMPTVGRQNRISLLSATSDYYQRSRLQMEHYRDESLNHNSHNTVSMNFMRERPDHGPPPPLKKPKLLHPISPQPPLKIDISEPPSTSAYNPQVEAISPTVDEPMPEYKKVNDVAPKLNKIESDLTNITQEIEDLIKLKENYELKEVNSEVTKVEPEEDTNNECEEEDPMKHLTPVQRIYASNRKKAYESRMSLEKCSNKTDLPLYNQPSDADVYHENRRMYSLFKSRLLEHLRKKKTEQQQKKTEITETYSKLYKEWLRRVEKIESSQKRKAKEAKHRELFEKVFPELRKAREDKERFNRVGARIKSEADLEEIMDGLQEQEMEDKKMRSYAVIPPLMLDPHQRHLTYLNNNGLVFDYKTEYNERKFVNIWTQQEKDVFKDRFIAHPKNFGAIASYLDKKSPSDCVQYYYLSKPKEEYKRLLRKAKWQARRRTAQNRTPASSSLNSLDILNSTSIGVTTRLQRERQGTEAASSNLAQASVVQHVIPENEDTPTSVEVSVTTEQCANNETENTQTNKDQCNESVKNLLQTSVASNTSELKSESKKKERRKDDKLKGENTSTTDEELMDSQHESGSKGDVPKGICAVCKAENVACPRTLNPSDAAQYGVKPEDITPGARVCNTCRCKVVRSQNRRVIYCPLPSCPTVQSSNRRPVKRLRPLPAKWNTAQDIIASEFQIGPTTTKCCSACFNRIQRRLMSLGVVGTSNNISTDTLDGWTDEETNSLKKGIREHGTRWSEISKLVGPNKSHYQCKEFYFSFRKKLGLDLLVQEYKKTIGSEQKPTLTDEEESGSSTSSCDETNLVLCDSDTQSAPSPTNTLPQTSPTRETSSPSQVKLTTKDEVQADNESNIRSTAVKEDYDSSATETADEGIGGTAESESSILQHSNNESEKKEKIVSDLSVSDILSDVIEKQFTKEHSNREKENGSMPTISSILLDPEYPIKDRSTISSNNDNKQQSMATISVVPPPSRELHHNKDGLLVVQVQSSKMSEVRIPEGVTLDLSIKRPRDGDSLSDPPPIKHAQPPPPPGTMYRTPPTQIHESNTFYSPQYAELGRSGKQGEIYWTKISPANNHVMVHPSQTVPHVTVKQTSHMKLPNKVTSPQLSVANVVSSKLSPNLLNNSKATGSIMHGTPVSAATLYMPPQTNRYSQSPQAPGGSITQGTPVHQRMLHNSSQNINTDYYHKRNPPQPQYQSRQPHFSEQRQIIMNDYITSQQMHSNVTAQFPRVQKPPVTSPMYYQPARQGVIQRHNTAPKATSPQSYPPGHEALGSLVDVAIRQPSLPVPLNHSEDRHREQDRYVRGSPVPKQHMYREQQRHEQQIQREREMAVQREREMQAVAQIREQQQREQYIRDKQMMHHRLTPEQHSRMVAAASFQQHQQRQQEQPRVMQIPSTVSSFQQSRSNTPVSRHQEPPSNIQNRDNSASGRISRQGMEPQALTAANLIDAIITHQINQSNDGNGHPPNTAPVNNQAHVQRAGDKLFQAFPEANEKQSLKPRASPEISSRPGEPYPEHSFKEYPSYMLAAGFEPHTWKLRRALQQKEFEQQMKDDNSRARFYPTQADIPISPLDYMKNRIAEVMRTSDDDNKNEPAYTYPFSAAINMSASATQKNNETSDTGGGGSILTAQYEPMSDED